MVNMAGGGGGHTGPYWRRQLGTTLPNEYTAAQLRIINGLRHKQGLEPVGGAVGFDTRFAQPAGDQSMILQRLQHGAQPAPDLRNQFFQSLQQQGGESHIPELDGGGMGGFEGPLPNPQLGGPHPMEGDGGPEDLRSQLLNKFGPQAQQNQLTSRNALLRYMQNKGVGVKRGPAKPILPPRKPLRQVQRPY